jgi:ABC-type bacteriocin/lantibiotic exporter with double-glycine peptidase domain
MIGLMFWLNWSFSLIALSAAPILVLVVYSHVHESRKPRIRLAL